MPCVTMQRVLAPAGEPVSLAEAKLFLRVEHGDDDTLINDIITGARETIEQYLKSALMTQTWKITHRGYAPIATRLFMPPAQAVSEVKTVTKEGTETVLDSGGYRLSEDLRHVEFDSVPLAYRVEVTYTAGYGDNATDVPMPIRQAILHYTAALYDARGDICALPPRAEGLLFAYREVGI